MSKITCQTCGFTGAHAFNCADREAATREIFGTGQKVIVGGVIHGVVEEVIFARSMTAPLYLVEWWHEGDLRARRFHECDLEAAQ